MRDRRNDMNRHGGGRSGGKTFGVTTCNHHVIPGRSPGVRGEGAVAENNAVAEVPATGDHAAGDVAGKVETLSGDNVRVRGVDGDTERAGGGGEVKFVTTDRRRI